MISNFEAKKADIFAFPYFSPLYLIRKSKEYTFLFFVNHDIRALSTFNRYFWEMSRVTSTLKLEHVMNHFIPGEFDSVIVPANQTMTG